MNETPKRAGVFSIFLFAFLVTMEVLTMVLLGMLGIFPSIYMVLIGAIMLLGTLLLWRMFFGKKPKLRRFKRAIAGFLSIFVTIGCLYGSYAAAMLGNTLNNITAEDSSSGNDTSSGLDSIISAIKRDVTTDPFIVYLSGSDARTSSLSTSRSDVNILVVVNPVDKQILLINTPRDYYVSNPAGNGAKDKLTHCGLKGPRNSVGALEELYACKVDYYAQINFSGFKTLIDAFGGVTIYSDFAFTTQDGYYIRAGENNLNGAQALSYVRERSALSGGDNARGQNQMKLIAALVDKLSAGTIISNYSNILNSLEGMFVTDMSTSNISKLIRMQLGDMASWDVLSYSATGTGGTDYVWAAGGYAYVTYPDSSSVAHATDLIARVMDGEVLTESDI